jgi:hypothetical protein
MSETDRGAYAPPTADAPLSFDARQPVRGSRPFPITLILSGLLLLGLIAAIIAFYRSGVRAAGEGAQNVGTPVGALKIAPPADAQPEDPAAGLQIYHAESGQSAQPAAAPPQFVPPPEQPGARPAAQAPAQPAQAQPVPAAATPIVPAASASLRAAASPAPVAAPQPKPVAAKPAVAQPVAAKPAPSQLVAAKPAPPPAAAKPATAQPVAAKPVAAAPKPAPAATAEEPAAKTAGAASVQIGAVSSTALADKAWSEAVAAAPGMAAGKGKGVEKIDKDGHTLYRTAVTGFASRSDAAAFCAKLKAAGKACFVK